MAKDEDPIEELDPFEELELEIEADEEDEQELPESPALADYSTETAPPAPSGGVTYTRGENGKLIAHYD